MSNVCEHVCTAHWIKLNKTQFQHVVYKLAFIKENIHSVYLLSMEFISFQVNKRRRFQYASGRDVNFRTFSFDMFMFLGKKRDYKAWPGLVLEVYLKYANKILVFIYTGGEKKLN